MTADKSYPHQYISLMNCFIKRDELSAFKSSYKCPITSTISSKFKFLSNYLFISVVDYLSTENKYFQNIKITNIQTCLLEVSNAIH